MNRGLNRSHRATSNGTMRLIISVVHSLQGVLRPGKPETEYYILKSSFLTQLWLDPKVKLNSWEPNFPKE